MISLLLKSMIMPYTQRLKDRGLTNIITFWLCMAVTAVTKSNLSNPLQADSREKDKKSHSLFNFA